MADLLSKKLNRQLRRRARRIADRLLVSGEAATSDSSETLSDSENVLVINDDHHVEAPVIPGNEYHRDSPCSVAETTSNQSPNTSPSRSPIDELLVPENFVGSSLSDSEPSSSDNGHSNNDVGMLPEDLPEYLIPKLQAWAVSGISKAKVDELLKIMGNVFNFLPRTARGLLHTPHHTNTDPVEGGEIWYKGIKCNLSRLVSEDYLTKYGKVVLDIGIDGIPLTKSGIKDFYPIMGRLEGDVNNPFLISVYCGNGKPQSLSDYFSKFCQEVLELQDEGFEFNGQRYSFEIRDYILDAVARAQVKCIMGHNSEKACEKCTVKGVYHKKRETFMDLDCPLRTDESFANRDDPDHHSGTSPLESILRTKMVSQFRLDAMHLIHLGIMKRFLKELFIKGSRKLHWRTIKVLSDALKFLSEFLPREFSRCCIKDFKYMARFKATEFRALLLYILVLIFKLLPSEAVNVYKCFLLLHVCVFILSSSALLGDYCQLAEQFARAFVEYSVALFGRHFCVYNVHSLIHIAQECREHGPLETFSAYPFENLLQVTVNVVKTSNHPLQQLINRDYERDLFLKERKVEIDSEYQLEQEKKRDCDLGGREFLLIKFKKGFTLGVNQRDRGFCTKDKDVVMLTNIVLKRKNFFCMDIGLLKRKTFIPTPLTPQC